MNKPPRPEPKWPTLAETGRAVIVALEPVALTDLQGLPKGGGG